MVSSPLGWVPLLGLLALGSVAAFWFGRGEPIVSLAAACVLLIVGSLVVMFTPERGPAVT